MEKKFEAKKISDKIFLLDLRGLACPFPQVLTVRGLDNLSAGDVLEVTLDNPPSVKDIPPAMTGRGYDVDVISLDQGAWKITIKSKK